MRSKLIDGMSVFFAALFLFTSSTVASDPPKRWKIPCITVLTGAIAHLGLESQWALKKAMEEINAGGGIAGRPVEIDNCDTGYDPTRAVSCMKQAVDESLVVMGPFSTLDVRACAAIASREGVMTLPAVASISEVKKSYPWAAVFIPSVKLITENVKDWMKMYPEIRSVVIFRDTKNPIWREEAGLFEIYSKEMGVVIKEMIDVNSEDVDVSAPIIRAMSRKPDGIIFGTEPAQTARLILELRKRGWENNNHFACHTATGSQSFIEVGGEEVEGVYIMGLTIDYDYPRLEWQNFIKEYADDHGGMNPPMYVPPYYDILYVVKAAIENTGITGKPEKRTEEREKIRDYIRNLKDFPGIYKPWSMDPEGWAHTDVFLGQISSGVIKAVSK